MADLKRTIHYLEHVAQPGADEQRAIRLKSMAEKLKATLEGLDGQLSRELGHQNVDRTTPNISAQNARNALRNFLQKRLGCLMFQN